MIRLLFRLLIFALGLVIAALWFGQMHHLRAVVPDQLPAWSLGIAENASVRRGSGIFVIGASGQGIEVTWAAKRLDQTGFHWDITANGDGLSFEGDVTLPFWPDRLLFDSRGTVDLEVLTSGQERGLLSVRSAIGHTRWDATRKIVFIDAEIEADVPRDLPNAYAQALASLGYFPGEPWRIRAPVPFSALQ